MEKIAAFLLLVSLVLNTQGGKDCQGDLCLKDLELKLYAKGVSNGLAYMDTGTDVTSKARDVLKVCSTNAELETTALATFPSCTGPMTRICTMAKRKWLKNDDNKQTVADSELILKSLAGLGGESIVNECLQIPEEYEEYEYYDYAYYDDYYDYLEETDNTRRVRRDAGKRGNNKRPKKGGRRNSEKKAKKGKKDKKGKPQKRRNSKSGKKKQNGRKNKKGKTDRKNKDTQKSKKKKKGKEEKKRDRKLKKGKKNENKDKKNEKKKEKLEKRKEKKKGEKNERKHTNQKPEDPENDAKISKKLAELGLKSLPSKDTLNGLTCVQQKIKTLLKQCAEGKLNQ